MNLIENTFKVLAFIDNKKEIYTTSEVVAECAEVQHETIQRLIRNHSNELMEFGKIKYKEIYGFQIRKLNSSGRPQKIYLLNEQQATLLITFLRNTEPVRNFKKELVKEFYRLKEELYNIRINRALEKPIRKELTEAVKNWEHFSPHSYKHITDLILKNVTGYNAKDLKVNRNNKSKTGIDLLSSAELKHYKDLENKVISLLELNFTYKEIKEAIKRKNK